MSRGVILHCLPSACLSVNRRGENKRDLYLFFFGDKNYRVLKYSVRVIDSVQILICAYDLMEIKSLWNFTISVKR